jgi:hypothetical protein
VTWLNTSVHSGFARSASEAMFPRLFPDVGWWCPSLNPAMGGTRLWDLSGRQNWGTLTNMANDDWVVSGGKLALDFDGSNDHVSVNRWQNMERDYSVSAWLRTTHAASNTAMIASSFNGGGGAHLMGVKGSNGALYTFDGAIEVEFTAKVLNDGVWHLATIVRRFGTSMTGFVDGVQVGQNNSTAWTGNPSSLGSGWRLGGTPFFGAQYPGLLDDFRIYSRALTAGEVRQLWQIGRGNMPLRRRRRYTEQAGGFKGYWANRQHLIGSGVY